MTKLAVKQCPGPYHRGQYVALSQFNTRKSGTRAGKPLSRCRMCHGVKDDVTGYVPLARVHFVFIELERRLGRMEACRRMKVQHNFYVLLEGKSFLQKRTVAKAMAVLREVREKNEVRHRTSIKHGAAKRGRQEREVVKYNDFYKSHGDHDTELRKRNAR